MVMIKTYFINKKTTMTKTREKIIGLIEPYMDKTLSEGCLITISVQQILWDYITITVPFLRKTSKESGRVDFSYLHPNGIIAEHCLSFQWCVQSGIKIIWHYNITAVLKFIGQKWYDYKKNTECELIAIKKFIWNGKWESEYIWTIEDKPLHLYSEQEEKDLLDVLLLIK